MPYSQGCWLKTPYEMVIFIQYTLLSGVEIETPLGNDDLNQYTLLSGLEIENPKK